MKKRKKLTSAILAFCVCVSLAGCGNTNSSTDNDVSNENNSVNNESADSEVVAESDLNQYINPKTKASFDVLNTYYDLKKESHSGATSFKECEFVYGSVKAYNCNEAIVFTERDSDGYKCYIYNIETGEATYYDVSSYVSYIDGIYYSEGNLYFLDRNDYDSPKLQRIDSEGNTTQVALPDYDIDKVYILNNGTAILHSSYDRDYQYDYLVVSSDFGSMQLWSRPQVVKQHGIAEDGEVKSIVGSYGTKIFASVNDIDNLYCFDTDTFTWTETDIFYADGITCDFLGKYAVVLSENKDSFIFYDLETLEKVDIPDITDNQRLVSVLLNGDGSLDLSAIESSSNMTEEEIDIFERLCSDTLSDVYSITDEQWDMLYKQLGDGLMDLEADWSILDALVIGNTYYSDDGYLTGVYNRYYYSISFTDPDKVPKVVQYSDESVYPSAASCMIDHNRCIYKDSYGIFIQNLETGEEETVVIF